MGEKIIFRRRDGKVNRQLDRDPLREPAENEMSFVRVKNLIFFKKI